MGRTYYRHPNGGGRVYSMRADVAPEAFVDENSMVGHAARVLGPARVLRSKIAGSAWVFGAKIVDSSVGVWLKDERGRDFESQPAFPVVQGDYVLIDNSHVFCEEVTAGGPGYLTVSHSELYEKVVVRDRAELRHVIATGQARVVGTAKVTGDAENKILLSGLMHLHEGEWLVAPRYAEVGRADGPIHVGVTECVAGKINVGCWCRPMEWWLARDARKGWRFAQNLLGWSDAEIAEVRAALLEWKGDVN
jgi:hypothetical protein